MSKKNKEKEPNLKLALAASIFFIILILICFIDTLKNLVNVTSPITVLMSLFCGGCVIALLWVVWYIIKRMKHEKQKQ